MKKLKNIHPGEILLEEFIKPLKIDKARLAESIGIIPKELNQIINGKKPITTSISVKLAKMFGMSYGFFSGLQADYNIEEYKMKKD